MAKYHLTDDGPKRCVAKSKYTCRAEYDGAPSEHFDSSDQANAAYENHLEEGHGVAQKSLTKKKSAETKRLERLGVPTYIDAAGNKIWYRDGKRHRIDGPAVMVGGVERWYVEGQKHRVGGPAVTYPNGTEYWYQNDQCHRDDGGPAIIQKLRSGDRYEWRRNNERHREDGPAVVRENGDDEWWVNGQLHRENGPAIERKNGPDEWWINGVQVEKPSFTSRLFSKMTR